MAASLIPYISCFDKGFDSGLTQSYQIAIQLALDGFSFLIHDASANRIIALESYRLDAEKEDSNLLQALTLTLQAKGWDLNRFSSAQFIIENPQNTLVPTSLYDKSEAAMLFAFNHTLPPDAQVHSDTIENAGCINLYPLSNTIYNGLSQLGNRNHIQHQTSILIRNCMAKTKSDIAEVHVHVREREFNIIIAKKGLLLFSNNFQFNTKDDFAYFLLLAMQQQGLSGQHTTVNFSGMILEGSDIIELCKRYIKNIRFVQPEAHSTASEVLQKIPFHYYYLAFQSLTCAL